MTKTLQQLREDLWMDRWYPSKGVKPAIKFRGKVYDQWNQYDNPTHSSVLSYMRKTLGIPREDIDMELDEKSFGYTVKGEFTNGDNTETPDISGAYKKRKKR